jgi:hypothetical protein
MTYTILEGGSGGAATGWLKVSDSVHQKAILAHNTCCSLAKIYNSFIYHKDGMAISTIENYEFFGNLQVEK